MKLLIVRELLMSNIVGTYMDPEGFKLLAATLFNVRSLKSEDDITLTEVLLPGIFTEVVPFH
ncbi:hypothetical protein PBCVAN69C_022R [Paramecium bursaria Chlorella virus AN69C]|nr:hypothetical protein PBCVAN69C_022R [Paramecium bursaria Chlorella virus AN69C]AGE57159.1 hypothetical protein PBCVNEJV4_022R [Paramecium bursaria Chlorella virus NE-JV-4]